MRILGFFNLSSKWALLPAALSVVLGCDSPALHASASAPIPVKTASSAVSLHHVSWPAVRPIKLSVLQSLPNDFPSAEIASLVSHRGKYDGSWGVSVVDLATHSVVYESGANLPMHPASTTKLLTTAFAMDVLGPNATFKTQVLTNVAPGADGVLQGPLVLVGGGDPNLSGRIFPFHVKTRYGVLTQPLDALADQLWAHGVRAVPAGLVADARRYPQEPPPPGWTPDDLTRWYGAPVSSLSFNDGVVFVTVRPGKRIGAPADLRIEPSATGLIQNAVTTGRSSSAIHLVDRGGTWQLQGQIGVRSGAASLRLPQPDPARFAITAFKDALLRRGIQVGEKVAILRRAPGHPFPKDMAYTNYTQLAELKSPPLREAVTVVNKVSQNLHAEMLMREASLALGGDGSLAMANHDRHTWLKQNALFSTVSSLTDGCGLSRDTLVTPMMLASVLSFGYQSPWGADWRASLPIGGQDGTLRHRFRELNGGQAEVQAKTGTLDGVSTLAGYIHRADGRDYAFAIMVNNIRGSEWAVKQRMDKIVDLIATNRVHEPSTPIRDVADSEQ